MSRILAYTSPARGHLYPLVPILLELRDRGHEISVVTLAAEVPALRALGLAARAIAPEVAARALDDWQGRAPSSGWSEVSRRSRHGRRTMRVICARPSRLRSPIWSWSTSTRGERWPPPSNGAGVGLRSARTP